MIEALVKDGTLADVAARKTLDASNLARAHMIEAGKYDADWACALNRNPIWRVYVPDNPAAGSVENLMHGRYLPSAATKALFAAVRRRWFPALTLKDGLAPDWPLVVPVAGAQPRPNNAPGGAAPGEGAR